MLLPGTGVSDAATVFRRLLVLLALLLGCACSVDEPERVEATSGTGLACEEVTGLVEDPSGEVAGYQNPEAAMRALAEAEGMGTDGLTLAVSQSSRRARGEWRSGSGDVVAAAVAEQLYDRGWYGMGLSRCSEEPDAEGG